MFVVVENSISNGSALTQQITFVDGDAFDACVCHSGESDNGK